MVSDASSVPAARRRVRVLTVDWGLRLDAESSVVLTTVVSEMVTNAVRHSGGPEFTVTLRASPRAGRILVEVGDHSSALPRLLPADDDAEGGRGMWLIGQLATASGAETTKSGKRVWAAVTIPEQPPARRRLFRRRGHRGRPAQPDGPGTGTGAGNRYPEEQRGVRRGAAPNGLRSGHL